MLLIAILTILRIFSNSLSGVFQKKLAKHLPSSLINAVCYLLLSLFCLSDIKGLNVVNLNLWSCAVFVGFLGAIGNSFQIKALKEGELSVLAPLNSYKIIFSLIFSYFILKEIPSLSAFSGVILIFWGSFFIFETIDNGNIFTFAIFKRKDILYRIAAVFFTALEAIFIKKLIILSNPLNALFLWAITSSAFSFLFFNFKYDKTYYFNKKTILNLIFLSLTMGIMQFCTNILFKMMNVSYALCLFQLSAVLSVFLGYEVFGEKNLLKKIWASFVMITGAVIIILNV